MGTIRFLLALSVLIVHSSPLFGLKLLPGYLAVQSFYIISGFYMAFIFAEKYTITERPLYNFYTNRLFRLYPLYLLTVLMTILLGLIYGFVLWDFGNLQYYLNQYQTNSDSLGSLVVFLAVNFLLVGQDVVTFFSLDSFGGLFFNGLQEEITIQEYLFIPIAWTISVEMFFYLLAPFFSKNGARGILWGIGAVLGLRLMLYLVFDVSKGFTVYRFAPTELLWFLLGMFSYHWKFLRELWIKKMSRWMFVAIILTFLLYRFYQLDWVILLVVFLFTPSIFDHYSKSKLDKYFGDLTYPLYISHCFFLLIVGANHFPKTFGTGPPVFLLTLIFSILVHHLFQKRIDIWRAKRISPILQKGL